MSETVWTLDEAPAAGDLDLLRAGLTEHSAAFVDRPGFRPLAVLARDRDGELIGGAYGHVNWQWLDVSLLWVTAQRRCRGLGSELMRRLESAAGERGCRRAHVETFSHQARGFYERHGYRAFALLPDYPPGETKVYLWKWLEAGSGE